MRANALPPSVSGSEDRPWFTPSEDFMDLLRLGLLELTHRADTPVEPDSPCNADNNLAGALLADVAALQSFAIEAVEGVVSSAATLARAKGETRYAVSSFGQLSTYLINELPRLLPLDPDDGSWRKVLFEDMRRSLMSRTEINVGDGLLRASSGLIELVVLERPEHPAGWRQQPQVRFG